MLDKGGTKIAFLTAAGGSNQIWEMNPDGTGRKQLSQYEGDIEGFKFSPDESKVLFISQVKYGERTADKYPDLDKASGMVIDDSCTSTGRMATVGSSSVCSFLRRKSGGSGY